MWLGRGGDRETHRGLSPADCSRLQPVTAKRPFSTLDSCKPTSIGCDKKGNGRLFEAQLLEQERRALMNLAFLFRSVI